MAIDLSDRDLVARLQNFEDNFVERKRSGDGKEEWVRTIVGFANSAPPDFPCVLYIGARDTGEPEASGTDFDSLQKTLNRAMSQVHPRIAYLPKILEVKGTELLAVVVLGSASRPHFAGLAYVRRGSETVEASGEQYHQLLAFRNSKARPILEWLGKPITVDRMNPSYVVHAVGSVGSSGEYTVADCNEFFVTLDSGGTPYSFPLDRISVSFDDRKHRLKLELRPS